MTPSLRITDKSRPQPTSYLPYVDTKFHEPTTVQEDRFLDLYKVMHVLILDLFFFEGSPEGERIPHLNFHCLCGPRRPDGWKGFVTGCSVVLHCLMKNRAPNISKRRVGNGEACMPTAWLQLCSFAVVGSLLPLLLGRQHHSVASTTASSTAAQKSQSAEPGCAAAWSSGGARPHQNRWAPGTPASSRSWQQQGTKRVGAKKFQVDAGIVHRSPPQGPSASADSLGFGFCR